MQEQDAAAFLLHRRIATDDPARTDTLQSSATTSALHVTSDFDAR
jgi:hypothetical protein